MTGFLAMRILRMRLTLGLCLLALTLLTAPYATAVETGRETESLRHDDLERTYHLYIPESIASHVPAPLLVVLHGGGGKGRLIERFCGFDDIARREGFIAVYPDAFDGHWNDGRNDMRSAAAARNVDDVGFIREMIAQIESAYAIDASRVYLVGVSNGGMMTHRLAAELTPVFAGAAAVIANIPASLLPTMTPQGPLPILLMNGTADPIVPWDGGVVGLPHGRERGTVASVQQTLDFWVAHNKAQRPPTQRELSDADPKDGTRIVESIYAATEGGAEVAQYVIQGGGHTYAGHGPYFSDMIVGATSRDIDASEVIWAFLSKQRRAK